LCLHIDPPRYRSFRPDHSFPLAQVSIDAISIGAISPQEKKPKAFLFFKKKPKFSGKGIIWSQDRQVTIPNFMVVVLIPSDYAISRLTLRVSQARYPTCVSGSALLFCLYILWLSDSLEDEKAHAGKAQRKWFQ